MPKVTTVFTCTNCDSQSPKWAGRCSECGQWGTLVEGARSGVATKTDARGLPTVALHELQIQSVERLTTGIGELDRVLGGGIVPGSLTLIGGDPGIGKSTLILQLAAKVATANKSVLYVSGEEAAAQIALRLRRLNVKSAAIDFLAATDIDQGIATARHSKPAVMIVDSIQTMSTAQVAGEAGSIQQVRAATVQLMALAKKSGPAVILVGHVTKDGAMAGPKALEHLVDVVLYMEGDPLSAYRILRCAKNRYGSANEIGVFDMHDDGLHEVSDPSRLFIGQRQTAPGAAVTAILEGSRPFAVEVQALTTPTVFGLPRRTASGLDINRLHVLLAVLSRRGGLKQLGQQDVFVNVVGGLKIQERAADLAVCLAIASTLKDKPLPSSLAAIGEVGLGGEVRAVPQIDRRIKELAQLGFKKILVPPETKTPKQITAQVMSVATVTDALKIIV